MTSVTHQALSLDFLVLAVHSFHPHYPTSSTGRLSRGFLFGWLSQNSSHIVKIINQTHPSSRPEFQTRLARSWDVEVATLNYYLTMSFSSSSLLQEGATQLLNKTLASLVSCYPHLHSSPSWAVNLILTHSMTKSTFVSFSSYSSSSLSFSFSSFKTESLTLQLRLTCIYVAQAVFKSQGNLFIPQFPHPLGLQACTTMLG